MYESLKTALVSWNAKTGERQKLQHIYLAIIVISIVAAGLVSLLNPDLGHNIVLIAIFAIVAFLANAIIWNLVKASFLSNLSARPKSKK